MLWYYNWKIDRLRIKLAKYESEVDTLNQIKLENSYYIDKLIEAISDVAATKIKLEIVQLKVDRLIKEKR